jgi:hypothetical protein
MAPNWRRRKRSATFRTPGRWSGPPISAATAWATFWWEDNNGNLAVWLMSGSAVLSSGAIGNVPPAMWTVAGTGDINGDGKADILGRDATGQYLDLVHEQNADIVRRWPRQHADHMVDGGYRRLQRRRYGRHRVA